MTVTHFGIHPLPQLQDNYAYLLHCPETGTCAVIDPAEPRSVLEAVAALGGRLTMVMNTHYHADHTGANLVLREKTGCDILGFAGDRQRIPGLTRPLADDETIQIGQASGRVIATPGHTSGDISYWFEDAAAVFTGDCLFSIGCGRLFEGTAADMWTSLKRLRALPPETQLFPGHDYTRSNILFAMSIDPANPALLDRAQEVEDLTRQGKATIPASMAMEQAANPFLRADEPDFKIQSGLSADTPAEEVFALLRSRKDTFKPVL